MSQHIIPLLDRLLETSHLWVGAQNASLPKLGRAVVNDTSFFGRITQPGASVTTATLEKFAGFLADPANWPEGAVPQEAIDLAHVTGVTPARPDLSPGNTGGNSPLSAQGVV